MHFISIISLPHCCAKHSEITHYLANTILYCGKYYVAKFCLRNVLHARNVFVCDTAKKWYFESFTKSVDLN